MCFATLGLGLLGEGASVVGGMMNQGAQAEAASNQQLDNARAAAASNAVLAKFLVQQRGNQQTNNAALAPTIAQFNPAAFQGRQAADAAGATAQATAAIQNVLAGVKQPALSNTDNGQTAAAIASRTATETGKSIRNATNAANLQAYGTNFAQAGLQEANSARNIDQTNTFARQQAQILPTDEQNAALQARQYVAPADTSVGSALQGLGNLFATAGGSGAASRALTGAVNYFNPSVSNPTLPSGSGGIGMN